MNWLNPDGIQFFYNQNSFSWTHPHIDGQKCFIFFISNLLPVPVRLPLAVSRSKCSFSSVVGRWSPFVKKSYLVSWFVFPTLVAFVRSWTVAFVIRSITERPQDPLKNIFLKKLKLEQFPPEMKYYIIRSKAN